MAEEAAAVDRISAMYLCGMSILKIKAALEAEGIMSPTGKSNRGMRTIDMILSNKYYCGLSVVKSRGQLYAIENHHEPTIAVDLYEKVWTAKSERTDIETGEDGRKLRKGAKFASQRTPDYNCPISYI